jgi:hypothetical protein
MKSRISGQTFFLLFYLGITYIFTHLAVIAEINGNKPLKAPRSFDFSDSLRGGARDGKDESNEAALSSPKGKGNKFFNQRQEREQLYEAYNLLHSLAQVHERKKNQCSSSFSFLFILRVCSLLVLKVREILGKGIT